MRELFEAHREASTHCNAAGVHSSPKPSRRLSRISLRPKRNLRAASLVAPIVPGKRFYQLFSASVSVAA